ncbi:MAG: AGE family epimerase/isomerase [Nitriliruptoraceae bacterium]
MERLVRFPTDPRHPCGGFAYLDACGRPLEEEPVHAWITGRMTHVYALAHLRGLPGASDLVDHGVAALRDLLHDHREGGWFGAVRPDGTPNDRKDAYQHAFVVLGASSAAAAERPGARSLLDAALEVFETRFWDEEAGRFVESFARDWTDGEPYRGANSNMHAVEASLAAGDVTGDARWHDRALRIATALIHGVAREHRWRVVEHFDAAWEPLLEYNHDQPDHPFRPYGTTVGHWLEWSRLLLHLEASLADPPEWLLPAAQALFQAAIDLGWAPDGSPGFVYTLDHDDRPVVEGRLHWVVAEGIAAAASLHERTTEPVYERWYRRLWDHAEVAFIDRDNGSWHHELDPDLRVAQGTWGGKPDLYHAVQATLLPQLALAPSLATQLAGHATSPSNGF